MAALIFTRYDGGVAVLWGANAILIAALLRTPLHRWWAPLLGCGLANGLATGFFGLGWAAAIPFMLVNLGESACAAWIVRNRTRAEEPLHSLRWFVRYVAGVGVAGPLLAAVLASLALLWLGRFSPEDAVHVFTGHALGNLTFTPLAMLLTARRARQEAIHLLKTRWQEALSLFTLLVVVSSAVFAQGSYPLLFLPIMVVILATFRMGRVGAALTIALLALIGGALTAAGHGPTRLLDGGDLATRLQFFQFYLAATVLTVLPVSADLHQRKALLRRLRLSEERFRIMAEHSSDLMMHIGSDGRFRYLSPSMRQIGGYEPARLVGSASSNLVAPEYLAHVRKQHWGTLQQPGETSRYMFEAVVADGSRRWFETHSRAVIDEDGEVDGVLSIARDITEAKLREERLADAAFTDHLTGLPNRRAFLAMAEERVRQGSVSTDCLALLDIDHFKGINDRYGHDVGDAVLRAFASVARGCLRAQDRIARFGGEEFVILFPDTPREHALAVCNRLRTMVAAAPLLIEGRAIRFTVSGGMASIDEGGVQQALRSADAALYEAKEGGRDQLKLAA